LVLVDREHHPLAIFNQRVALATEIRLFIESTYGEYLHESSRISRKYLKQAIVRSFSFSIGSIQNYLKALLPDERTDVLFVVYQAVMLLGLIFSVMRLYLWLVVWLYDNEKIDIIAKVHTLLGYRAHADQKNLFNFVKLFQHKPMHISIIHLDEGG
jgi:metallo-beta-lactamase family protein